MFGSGGESVRLGLAQSITNFLVLRYSWQVKVVKSHKISNPYPKPKNVVDTYDPFPSLAGYNNQVISTPTIMGGGGINGQTAKNGVVPDTRSNVQPI